MPQENNAPFQDETIKHPEISANSRFNTILQLKNSPEYVVKEITAEWLKRNVGQEQPGESEAQYLERLAARGQQLQREFSATTGIQTAGSQLIVARNEQGQEVLYRATQQVRGVDLEDAIRDDQVPEPDVTNLVTAEFQYFKQKLEDGGDFMSDVQYLDQFRYGRVGSETKDSIYFADTDPVYGVANQPEPANADIIHYDPEHMVACVLDMIRDISEIRHYQSLDPLEKEVEQFMQEHAIRENPRF